MAKPGSQGTRKKVKKTVADGIATFMHPLITPLLRSLIAKEMHFHGQPPVDRVFEALERVLLLRHRLLQNVQVTLQKSLVCRIWMSRLKAQVPVVNQPCEHCTAVALTSAVLQTLHRYHITVVVHQRKDEFKLN
jgi:hypothetical protein